MSFALMKAVQNSHVEASELIKLSVRYLFASTFNLEFFSCISRVLGLNWWQGPSLYNKLRHCTVWLFSRLDCIQWSLWLGYRKLQEFHSLIRTLTITENSRSSFLSTNISQKLQWSKVKNMVIRLLIFSRSWVMNPSITDTKNYVSLQFTNGTA